MNKCGRNVLFVFVKVNARVYVTYGYGSAKFYQSN